MSMCTVISYVAGRGCLLWPMYSLRKTLLAFALLHFVFHGIHFYFILYSVLYSSLIFRNEKERESTVVSKDKRCPMFGAWTGKKKHRPNIATTGLKARATERTKHEQKPKIWYLSTWGLVTSQVKLAAASVMQDKGLRAKDVNADETRTVYSIKIQQLFYLAT